MDQQDVLVGMRLRLAAGGRLRRGGLLGAVAATLRPIHGPMGGALQGEGAGGHLAGIACWGQGAIGAGALPDREPGMHPVVGLGWAQPAWPAGPRLPRMRLLRDPKKEPLVCPLRQDAVGAAPALPLAHLPVPGLVRWIQRCLGRGKRREPTHTLCMRPSGRGQKLSRSVLSGEVS